MAERGIQFVEGELNAGSYQDQPGRVQRLK